VEIKDETIDLSFFKIARLREKISFLKYGTSNVETKVKPLVHLTEEFIKSKVESLEIRHITNEAQGFVDFFATFLKGKVKCSNYSNPVLTYHNGKREVTDPKGKFLILLIFKCLYPRYKKLFKDLIESKVKEINDFVEESKENRTFITQKYFDTINELGTQIIKYKTNNKLVEELCNGKFKPFGIMIKNELIDWLIYSQDEISTPEEELNDDFDELPNITSSEFFIYSEEFLISKSEFLTSKHIENGVEGIAKFIVEFCLPGKESFICLNWQDEVRTSKSFGQLDIKILILLILKCIHSRYKELYKELIDQKEKELPRNIKGKCYSEQGKKLLDRV
jgi:hypothetical protein